MSLPKCTHRHPVYQRTRIVTAFEVTVGEDVYVVLTEVLYGEEEFFTAKCDERTALLEEHRGIMILGRLEDICLDARCARICALSNLRQ